MAIAASLLAIVSCARKPTGVVGGAWISDSQLPAYSPEHIACSPVFAVRKCSCTSPRALTSRLAPSYTLISARKTKAAYAASGLRGSLPRKL